MRKVLSVIAAMLIGVTAQAATSYTVKIVYDGASASVLIPTEVSNYVTCTSGTSSHVVLEQSSTADDNPGEIIYNLSGSSEDGELLFTGDYKATFQLNGVTRKFKGVCLHHDLGPLGAAIISKDILSSWVRER